MQDFVHQQYHNDLHSNVAALFVRRAQIMRFFFLLRARTEKNCAVFFSLGFFLFGGGMAILSADGQS